LCPGRGCRAGLTFAVLAPYPKTADRLGPAGPRAVRRVLDADRLDAVPPVAGKARSYATVVPSTEMTSGRSAVT
jgi:hypothetical protein